MNCDIVIHALLVNNKFFFLDMMAESKENLKNQSSTISK
jgi:hypothetical protein